MLDLTSGAVLVAGGAGFIGSALVRELLSAGVKTVCYDNCLHGRLENVATVPGPLTVVYADVLDTSTLARVIREHEVHYLISCVGDTFVPTAYALPARFFDVNLRATLNLLMTAIGTKIRRVLYLSSTEVYGNTAAAQISEDAPFDPANTYAVSKLAADRLCSTLHREHGLPVVIARVFNCYGPRETHPYVIPDIISQLHKGSTLRLGNVQAERDLTYVHDAARALIAVLASDIPNGDAVNVGSGTSFSVEWLARTLAEMMHRADVEIRHDPRRERRCDVQRFRCDNSKLRAYTGWRPRMDIAQGLRATVDWFRANNARWSWEEISQDVLPDDGTLAQHPPPDPGGMGLANSLMASPPARRAT
jgi:nucleoside-diphosphate-sugar epimerase